MSPELGTALTRRTDEPGQHPRLVDQSGQCGFAVPRMSFKCDLLRINERVLLEETDQLARTPGQGAERAPVVDLARLTFVDETDDALPQLIVGAAVGLDAARIEIAVAPAERDGRLLPTRGAIRERRIVSGRRCRTASPSAA